MTSSEIDEYYTTSLNLVKKAGEVIRANFSAKKTIETKSCEIDFVTETDRQVEKLLIDGLSSNFPEHKFIGEESVSNGAQCNLTHAPTWIIDPVDGTMNFVHSFPHSCISLALFINAVPEIAIIYNPVLNQLFTAKKGKGAFINGNRMNVSGETNLSKALLTMECGTGREPSRMKVLFENLHNLVPAVHGIRQLGSAALNMAMVACGGADAYFEFGIHIWDIAAGELLVTEAGGVVIDPSGGPIDRLSRRVLAAASPQLAEQLSQKLVQYYPTTRD